MMSRYALSRSEGFPDGLIVGETPRNYLSKSTTFGRLTCVFTKHEMHVSERYVFVYTLHMSIV